MQPIGKSANVSVIDTTSLEVIATIPADKGPHNVTISPDGKLALVANVGANNVTFIDAVAKKVLANVPAAGPRTHHVSVSPDGRTAVASNMGGDTVTLIDIRLAKNIGSITTDKGALMSVYSPDGQFLYVVNAKAATISVVEEHFREVIGVLPGEKDMRAFVPTRDWLHAWVSACSQSGSRQTSA